MPGPTNKKNKSKKKAFPISSLKENGSISEGPDLKQESSDSTDTLENEKPSEEGDRCIENKWNGPRVLDVSAFMSSRFAVGPTMEDPHYAVYATPEVRETLLRVLPTDTALILWYNKSRKSARICPACRRFYTVGDILLPNLMDDQSGSRAEYVDPRNSSEKRISGLCSLMCFGIAAYNWPGSIGAWGKRASEIDPETLAVLHGRGANIADDGMGSFMKLSRMDNMLDVISDAFNAGRTIDQWYVEL